MTQPVALGIDDAGVQVLLWPRPRRFGKSLNLSMLRYYLGRSDDQGFIIGLLAVMESTHLVRSNRESGAGRPDVLITPRTPGQPGVVLELKIARQSARSRSHRRIGTDCRSRLRHRTARGWGQANLCFRSRLRRQRSTRAHNRCNLVTKNAQQLSPIAQRARPDGRTPR